jgi:hypothetical protein
MDLFGIDKFLKEVLYKLVDERTKEIKDKADKTAETVLNLREDLSNTRSQLSK